MASEFRQQLAIGAPTNQDEAGLRRLSHQLKTQKLIIKTYLGSCQILVMMKGYAL